MNDYLTDAVMSIAVWALVGLAIRAVIAVATTNRNPREPR